VRHRAPFLSACALAAVAPWFLPRPIPPAPSTRPTPWPTELAGIRLEPQPLTTTDLRFAAGLPGPTARFRAGARQVLCRELSRPAARLHSLARCYTGDGYEVGAVTVVEAFALGPFASFRARRGDEDLRVYERIEDGSGRVHTDLAAWYWSALWGSAPGPHRYLAVVERIAVPRPRE
jgi:hypothetical protein